MNAQRHFSKVSFVTLMVGHNSNQGSGTVLVLDGGRAPPESTSSQLGSISGSRMIRLMAVVWNAFYQLGFSLAGEKEPGWQLVSWLLNYLIIVKLPMKARRKLQSVQTAAALLLMKAGEQNI